MGKIKVGVFGANRGKTMIDVLADHPEAELVAVCDKYKPLLDEIKKLSDEKNMHVAVYENFEDFFKHDMDAVVLANYANEHSTYAVRLLNSGRHIMSEVLPCETMAQAVELVEAVEKTGLVYSYAENYCYMDGTFEMLRRYERGDVGEVMYCEGEYVHDCSTCWHSITYGERDHWRNRLYSTYYCTHSIGPMLMITGRRPVQVVGFETQPAPYMRQVGSHRGCAGLEIVTLDNGAIAKSIHGDLKREPPSVSYEIYGDRGCMETDRFDNSQMKVYTVNKEYRDGKNESYAAEKFLSPDMAKNFNSHGGSDFYATHLFLQRILGRPEGVKYSIDVYKALDMGICGILAYRSILNGNVPIKVPNFRNKEEREPYRNDNACTNPDIASGKDLLPLCSRGKSDIPQEVFDRVREEWMKAQQGQQPDISMTNK